MKFLFDAVVISTQMRESKGKEYYKINLDQDGEIITLDCTPEVARHVAENKYKSYRFQGVYARGEFEGRVFTRMSVVSALLNK